MLDLYNVKFWKQNFRKSNSAAQWIAPTLNKVLSIVAGPVGMIHAGIGGALGAGANLAGVVNRLVNRR
ncbi:MAG: hypothetical protein EZS28_008280 [Streblomastix strix]|uniref:Uncharacterized protein n=1 Tax=Streblomastix strix TaxID=222440 RepID=A0A5J4WNJ5_9EUKA|nr:MAG: hypothetical protein EZS28_008280 [Streblomastix strix]